ncbi:MAG: hypothetical protein GXN93_01305 [Candidatus Diapherotrites archaeon]|nr:hypothetical protein [Candidatus Diapherotrites archaeon]
MQLLWFVAGAIIGAAIMYILLSLWHSRELRSLRQSYNVRRGQFVEQLAPYLQSFPYDPKDVRFIGAPVDFIVFDGLSAGRNVDIVFVEVKSGKAGLNANERRIRDAVENKRVRYEVFRQ